MSSSPPSITTFYDILGIPTSAEPAAIRSAFKRSLLQFHPDKIPLLEKQENNGIPFSQEQKDAMTAKFQACVKAANCLLDPQSKARYDAIALGKQMIDITGRVSETCSLKEEFELASENEDDEEKEEDSKENGGMLYLRECRCGGYYSVIWNKQQEEVQNQNQKSTSKKYATCDSCSLVIEVECDL